MSDDKSRRAGQDGERIDPAQDCDAPDGARKPGVMPDELKAAVKVVRNYAAAVDAQLKRTRR